MRALLAVLVALAGLPAIPALAQSGPPAAPQATTGAARSVTASTAGLTGTVDPNGTLTSYRFEYGTSERYGLRTQERTAGSGDDPAAAEAAVEGLTPSTTYHYRIVATSTAGTTNGEDRTFRTAAATPNPSPPGASTSSARGVGTTTATLAARVDPNRASTRVRFEYGTSTAYGSRSGEVDVGAGDTARDVTTAIGRLRPRTTYHFRVVATNAAGVTRGRDRTFQTSAAPSSVSLELDTDRVALGGTVTITGRVRGTGVGRLPIALEAQPFPFGATPFAQRATASTAGSGAFRFQVGTLLTTTRLRVVTRSRIRVASPTATVLVRLRVGVRPGAAESRRRATVAGTVTPATPGARVSVQRRTSTGRFVRVGRTTTQPLDAGRSRYRLTITRTRRTSVYRVSVLPPADGPHVRGTSREFRVRGRGRN